MWNEEIARIWARHDTMSPATAAAVTSVLRSILREQLPDDGLALSTLALLEECGID